MGCCLSTGNSKLSAPDPQKHHNYHHSPRSLAAGDSRAPPPSAEEETVKEVLSETHRPKPSPISNPKSDLEEDEEKKQIPKPEPVLFPIIKLNDEKIDNTTPFYHNAAGVAAAEEISEVSEICSLSESVSATTTITRDDDEEFMPRVYRSPMKLTNKNNRSFSGDLGSTRRERAVGKSPTRRANQSPGRINGFGSGQGMARRGLRMMDLQQQQQRRDWGAGSGSDRRSRSPATNRTDNGVSRSGVGRSPSARRSVRSPGRAGLGPNPNDGINRRRGGEDNRVEEGKWAPPATKTTTDESLENPLVSLECFIFL